MTMKLNIRKSIQTLLLIGISGLALHGCKTEQQVSDQDRDQISMAQLGEDIAPITTGGAMLWAQNCIRCHNIRNPASLSDRQWEIVLHHMRVRANLTVDEHQSILEFLKAAN